MLLFAFGYCCYCCESKVVVCVALVVVGDVMAVVIGAKVVVYVFVVGIIIDRIWKYF